MTPDLTLRRARPSVEPGSRFSRLLRSSPRSESEAVSDAILASAERARRLGDTVPLKRDDPYWLVHKGRILISTFVGGLSLWSMAVFLLTLE
jgi:hypothetical protein